MSEAIATKQPKEGMSWFDITKRILVGLLMFLVVVGLIADMAGLVGVWVVRGPAYDNVTDVTATLTNALGTVNNGLTRVNTRVQNAQQSIKNSTLVSLRKGGLEPPRLLHLYHLKVARLPISPLSL